MITLRKRLALTYALFISLALGLLTVVINLCTGRIFNALIKDNIAQESAEIVRAVGELYQPLQRDFDRAAVEAIGMYFVHKGYIITVEDLRGGPVWRARSCDMAQCRDVISDIASRMEGQFRINGGLQTRRYPVLYNHAAVGAVVIETYGPFFYSETETRFLSSLNRLLLLSTAALALLSIAVSLPLAQAIARPVNRAAEAARVIARAHSGGGRAPPRFTPIPDQYRTRELAGLSRSINALAAELDAGERRQRQLSADIAHELRTPLTCLQGNMEALIDGVYRPDREHLESCREEILRLTSLVEDLTTLSILEDPGAPRPLHTTRFDLAALLQSTAGQFRAAAEEKGLELRLEFGGFLGKSPVTGDYDRLKQVFINLLSNALTYTDRGGVVLGIAPGGGGWVVSVADTGMGIPEEDLPHIFERLYRSDKSRSRRTGGAGIGLSIAAAIVHAHGGTIHGASPREAGGAAGSVFWVSLPPAPAGFSP